MAATQRYIGIDEVGRGCWAGPLLVVAARSATALPSELTDSKLLTSKQRQSLMAAITSACQFGEGWVQSVEIDELGLTRAMSLGVKRALTALNAKYDERIIMDGKINYCSDKFVNVDCVIKADKKHKVVSAASVYAKVKRDQHMTKQAKKYPHYGFEQHVGYGTAQHRQALLKQGVSAIHRKSYKPIAKMIKLLPDA